MCRQCRLRELLLAACACAGSLMLSGQPGLTRSLPALSPGKRAALHAAGGAGLSVPPVQVPARVHVWCGTRGGMPWLHCRPGLCGIAAEHCMVARVETYHLACKTDAAPPPPPHARMLSPPLSVAVAAALLYVTSTLTLPNAVFTFLAHPEEATKYGAWRPGLVLGTQRAPPQRARWLPLLHACMTRVAACKCARACLKSRHD